MMNDRIDKAYTCCATCRYWCGARQYDGIGSFHYNGGNDKGVCGQVMGKGFSTLEMEARAYCGDYEQMIK